MSTTLERPSARWRESYLGLIAEFKARDEPLIPFPLSFPTDDFPAFLAGLEASERGENLPAGFVAHSSYWLVENDTEVVAVSNLRHELTPSLRVEGGHIGYGVRPSARRRGHATAILAATLTEARRRGIHRCLITCDRENEGSARTILRNGGVLHSEVPAPHRDCWVQRYWIELPPEG
ncbi:GNAT family N-acetyltransferase [Actomonas aquatica]|uniref:GNAT family N-acetyltransferase n=1 Tax=Actomonas aquatica TaxID=2866162 RepID=A0ABZ1C7X3_9BACT|nr:GNAT family N-acetyltransferase [Opitutus sp. WL0086]WRQ87807.1 GNAT family N-acetyltransferase [Opitutus sp. WL0086]